MAKEIQLQFPNMEEGTKLQAAKSLEGTKLLYILVQDDVQPGADVVEKPSYHRYTRPLLQSTLQLMGCKQRHAIKISDLVFEVIKSEMLPKKPKRDRFMGLAPLAEIGKKEPKLLDSNGFKVDPKPLKKRSTATVSRDKFLTVVCDALKQYQYLGPKQRADLMVACRVRERKTSVTVLLCGTSGCGKSTLASLLGHRLGITTVVSTDSVRHMMRGFVSEKENPLLWASTYHAGEYLDPIAVSEAYHKKKEAKQASLPIRTPSTGASTPTEFSNIAEQASTSNGDGPSTSHKGKGIDAEETQSEKSAGSGKLEGADSLVSSKVMAVQGFKAQSEMVMDSLDRLITAWETKKESVVIEGVHLSLNFVMGLMKKHPSIIPFMVYIGNESKHMERFAVRAKYMTLDPTKNKYVKYIRNIRTIQDWLCQRADKHLVPKVNNTNVDKSVAAIHTTVFNCLRRREDGEPLLDAHTNTVKVVHQEYTKQYTASSLGSKGMFQLIQRKGSSRNMMAIMNEDGTVAKAWPLLSVQVEKRTPAGIFMDRVVGTPQYGPMSVGTRAPVNLQFGSLGLSAWPSDKGGSSDYNKSATQTQAQAATDEAASDNILRGASTASSGAEKELIEEAEVSGSDEEMEEEEEKAEKEGESSGSEVEPVEDEIEGSVDDGSGRSEGEEEFVEDDAYWEYDESSPTPRPPSTGKDKKASMLRLRSFDQASAGRGAPILRKSVSHTTRVPSRRHSFKPTTQSTTQKE